VSLPDLHTDSQNLFFTGINDKKQTSLKMGLPEIQTKKSEIQAIKNGFRLFLGE
jgi:hypothetical protein